MGNYGPSEQLYRQANGGPAAVPQKATRRKRGLTMTAGMRLPIETTGNEAVTWYLMLLQLVPLL